MSDREVKGDDYEVQYESATSTVYFKGDITLGNPKEYVPIVKLLDEAADAASKNMTLNLKELAFLNSSGISMLSKFVQGMKKRKGIQLVVLGAKKTPWQGKSLKNLERLLPGLKLVIE